MKKINQILVVLIVLMSTISFASATTTSSPNTIDVNVISDATTVVTVTHVGDVAPAEIKFTLEDITSTPYGITTELEGSWDGSSWSNAATETTYVTQTFDGTNYTTTWTFSVRDVPLSSDVGQTAKLYRAEFQVTDVLGQYDSQYATIDASNTDIIPVPEFPTIALPVAAILGLAFIFQRRKEEE